MRFLSFCVRFFVTRTLFYALAPALYWACGLLNYNQAAKASFLGLLLVLAISALQLGQAQPQARRQVAWLSAVVAVFYALMAYQAFLREFFGVAPDDALVFDAIFNTSLSESMQFAQQSWRGISKHTAIFIAFMALYYALNFHHSKRFYTQHAGGLMPQCKRALWLIGGICLGLFTLLHANPTMRRTSPLFYFPERYIRWHGQIAEVHALQQQLASATKQPQLAAMRFIGQGNNTVVFVLGESMTRHNLSLYGYPRPTTPQLQAVATELTVFTNILSAAPVTDGSLKLMLTPATQAQPDLWVSQPDILTIAKRAGYKTFWLSNQETRRGATSVFASHADEQRFTNKGSSRGEGLYDEVLLPNLAAALQDPAPLKFILVHMLGNHATYRFRYPEAFALFDSTDDRVSQDLKAQGRAPWAILERGQYDNSILYSDDFLLRSLKRTQASSTQSQKVSWLYTPDHGEDVAHHNNTSGHNPRVRQQWEVPMLAWQSSQSSASAHLGQRSYQNDVLDHTLLGLLQIEGPYYDPQHDILAAGFRVKPRWMNKADYSEPPQR